MRYHSRTFIHLLVCIFLGGCAHVHPLAGRAPDDESFTIAAKAAMDALASGNDKAFVGYIDATGLELVKRMWAPGDTGLVRDPEDPTKLTEDARRGTLLLGSLDAVQWNELSVKFESSQYNGDSLSALLRQFTAFIRDSRDVYHGERYLEDEFDHWKARRLQNCVEGILASSVNWYIYFHRTPFGWRIYRMEWAAH